MLWNSQCKNQVDRFSVFCIERQGFYQLQKKGVFPKPIYSGPKRPYYPPYLQQKCIEIRKTGIGYKEKAIDVTLTSLENYMQSFYHNNHVSLVCIKQCNECLLFINEKFKQTHLTAPVISVRRQASYSQRAAGRLKLPLTILSHLVDCPAD